MRQNTTLFSVHKKLVGKYILLAHGKTRSLLYYKDCDNQRVKLVIYKYRATKLFENQTTKQMRFRISFSSQPSILGMKLLEIVDIQKFNSNLLNHTNNLRRFENLTDRETPRVNYWSFGYRGVYYNGRVEIQKQLCFVIFLSCEILPPLTDLDKIHVKV